MANIEADVQPQPNLVIFSLTFDGYIDASKPRGSVVSSPSVVVTYRTTKLPPE